MTDTSPATDECRPGCRYHGWFIDFEYGYYTAIGPNYDAELTDDGWVDNGQRLQARTLADLQLEIDCYREENPTRV